MASLDSVKTRYYLASGTVQQVGTDSPVAIRLRYVGTGIVTSVTVTTATNIVTVTTEGTKTYAFASFATIGALADKINSDGIFEAKVIDALRSQASASTLVTGAVALGSDENGVPSYNVLIDTSAAARLSVALSPERSWDAPKGHRVHLQEIAYLMNVGTEAGSLVRIYKRRGTVETLIFSGSLADAAATVVNFAGGNGKLSAGNGEELVVLATDAGSFADAATNYLRITGIVE